MIESKVFCTRFYRELRASDRREDSAVEIERHTDNAAEVTDTEGGELFTFGSALAFKAEGRGTIAKQVPHPHKPRAAEKRGKPQPGSDT